LAVTVVLLVVLAAAVAGLSRESLITASSSSGSSSLPAAQHPSTQISSSAGLNITNMVVVVLSGGFQPPSSNSATIKRQPDRLHGERRTTFTVERQHRIQQLPRQQLSCGDYFRIRGPASFTVKAITVIPPIPGRDCRRS